MKSDDEMMAPTGSPSEEEILVVESGDPIEKKTAADEETSAINVKSSKDSNVSWVPFVVAGAVVLAVLGVIFFACRSQGQVGVIVDGGVADDGVVDVENKTPVGDQEMNQSDFNVDDIDV